MPDDLHLEPRAVLSGSMHSPGLVTTEWPVQALASVVARGSDLARLGIDAPDRLAWRDGWIATGPGRWLVARRQDPPRLIAELESVLAGTAAIVDLSHAHACFTLRGAAVRDVLARGITLDLDPASFGPGSAAVTAVTDIGVVFWCEDDAESFELAVTRSYTGSFLHWLDVSAAAVGLELTG